MWRGPAPTRRPARDLGLRRSAQGQGLPRQDAQFRFGPVEPAAVPGRKYQPYRWARSRAPDSKLPDHILGCVDNLQNSNETNFQAIKWQLEN